MESLIRPDGLHTRILLWAREEITLGEIPAKSDTILQAILYRGEFAARRGRRRRCTGERQARRIVAALLKRGIPISEERVIFFPTG